MKNVTLFIAALFILVFSGFKAKADLKLNSADVDQIQGLYIFYHSKPSRTYDYLGTVSSPAIIKNYKGSYLVELMAKRAKEKHSTCNAIIFKNEDMTEVDAVLVK
jgi:hypothetical protein